MRLVSILEAFNFTFLDIAFTRRGVGFSHMYLGICCSKGLVLSRFGLKAFMDSRNRSENDMNFRGQAPRLFKEWITLSVE